MNDDWLNMLIKINTGPIPMNSIGPISIARTKYRYRPRHLLVPDMNGNNIDYSQYIVVTQSLYISNWECI